MADQMVNGGWYNGRQFWNGQLGAPGVIINPNQQGAGQAVSAAVNQQSSIAQGKAPDAIQNYLAQQTAQQSGGGGGGGVSAGGGLPGGVFDQAQSILNFQSQANKPVTDALQGQQTKLADTYQKLLDSIKGNNQTDINNQVKSTNTELGNRGIDPSSGLYQQTLTDAQTPINQQYAGVYANAENQYNSSAGDLAVRIAQAQAGDPLQALQLAQSISSSKANNPYMSVGNDSSVFNTQTGQYSQNPNTAASAASGW